MTSARHSLAVAAVLALALVGAPASDGHAASNLVPVDGGIFFVGGPCCHGPLGPVPGTVTVRRDSRVVTQVRVAGRERFEIRLEPGRYQFRAHSSDAQCIPKRVPVLRPSTTVRLICSVS